MPNPEKLAKQGKFYEAAKSFYEKANTTKSIFKKRRYLDSAARCYESAGEYFLATKCFLEAGNLEAALKAGMKSKKPEDLSKALIHHRNTEEALSFLITCALDLMKQQNFVDAKKFCEEALRIEQSPLPEALMNIINGVIENSSEKIVNGLKISRAISEKNHDLATKITFIAKSILAEFSPAQLDVSRKEKKPVISRCPNCGALLPKKKTYSDTVQCPYCGCVVRM